MPKPPKDHDLAFSIGAVLDEIAQDMTLVDTDFHQGAFLSGFRHWALDPLKPVEDPVTLAQKDGIKPSSVLSIGLFRLRNQYIPEFGFCVPTPALVTRLSQIGPILEVGAGTGFLARLVQNAGGDLIATDKNPGEMSKSWCSIRKMSALEAVEAFPDRTLLSSWPSLNEDWLTQAADRLETGQTLIMIGEYAGGCTGSDCLYDLLTEVFTPAPDVLEGADVWRFPAIHDTAQAFRRR
jgi:hypothetical protein